jgi:hypothetical protein
MTTVTDANGMTAPGVLTGNGVSLQLGDQGINYDFIEQSLVPRRPDALVDEVSHAAIAAWPIDFWEGE